MANARHDSIKYTSNSMRALMTYTRVDRTVQIPDICGSFLFMSPSQGNDQRGTRSFEKPRGIEPLLSVLAHVCHSGMAPLGQPVVEGRTLLGALERGYSGSMKACLAGPALQQLGALLAKLRDAT